MKILELVELGKGFNSIQARPMREVIKGKTASPIAEPRTEYSLNLIESRAQLREILAVAAGVSVSSFSTLSPILDANFGLNHESFFEENMIHLVISVRHVMNIVRFEPDYTVVPELKEIDFSEPKEFRDLKSFLDKYGDMYVSDLTMGRELFCMIQIHLDENTRKNEIKANLKAQISQVRGSSDLSYLVENLHKFGLTKYYINSAGVDQLPSGYVEISQLKEIIKNIETSFASSKSLAKLSVNFMPYTALFSLADSDFAQQLKTKVADSLMILSKVNALHDEAESCLQYFNFDDSNHYYLKNHDAVHAQLMEQKNEVQKVIEVLKLWAKRITEEELFDDREFEDIQAKLDQIKQKITELKARLPELSEYTLVQKLEIWTKKKSGCLTSGPSTPHFRISSLPPGSDHLKFMASGPCKLDLKRRARLGHDVLLRHNVCDANSDPVDIDKLDKNGVFYVDFDDTCAFTGNTISIQIYAGCTKSCASIAPNARQEPPFEGNPGENIRLLNKRGGTSLFKPPSKADEIIQTGDSSPAAGGETQALIDGIKPAMVSS